MRVLQNPQPAHRQGSDPTRIPHRTAAKAGASNGRADRDYNDRFPKLDSTRYHTLAAWAFHRVLSVHFVSRTVGSRLKQNIRINDCRAILGERVEPGIQLGMLACVYGTGAGHDGLDGGYAGSGGSL